MHRDLVKDPSETAAGLAGMFAESCARFPHFIHEADFLMAGSRVRATLVGVELSQAFGQAFAHLQVAKGFDSPDLHVRLWDAAATGIGEPSDSALDDPSAPGETLVGEGGRHVYFGRPQIRTVLDRSAGTITGVVTDAAQLTLYDLGRPLHSELLLWHHDRGLLPVHAGLVARGPDGVLLAGPGGSGKSTTSVLCYLRGFSYLADDYVALEWGAVGDVTGHSIYNSTHIEPEHLERFPESIKSTAIPGRLTREDKSLILLSEMGEGTFSGQAKVRFIGLPRVAQKPHTTVRPASKVETLLRLAPSSLFLVPYQGMGRPGFERLSELVDRLPAWWIELGEDFQEIPDVVDRLLAEVTAS